MPEQEQGKKPYPPMVKLGSVWEKRNDVKGTRFWSGMMGNGTQILMFRCKSDHPQAPTFDIYLQNVPRFQKGKGSTDKMSEDDYKTKPPATSAIPQAQGEPVDTSKDEDLPF
jgi:hypothetical protein